MSAQPLKGIAMTTLHFAVWAAALTVIHLTILYGVSEAVGMMARTYYNMRIIQIAADSERATATTKFKQ